MAYSYIRYAGNGSTTNYVFSFPYISADHIQVRVNGVVTTLFSFLNSSTVQMATAPASGAILDIRRVTPKDTALVNFTDGSVLLERDLDLLATFDLYLAQETKDGLDAAIQQDYLGVYDALTKRIANVADPVAAQDAVTKNWVETTYTPTVEAIALASAASASASDGSATASANSASAAAASYDSFDDRYLGAKATAPTMDNDGNTLLVGATYWNTPSALMFTWSGTGWRQTFLYGTVLRQVVTATTSQTVVATPTYLLGSNSLLVFVNGVKVLQGTDYTETTGNSITFTTGLTAGDEVELISQQSFPLADIDGSAVNYYTGNGVTTTFSVPGYARSVYISGTFQRPNSYSITETSITFSEAPPFNSGIEIYTSLVNPFAGTIYANQISGNLPLAQTSGDLPLSRTTGDLALSRTTEALPVNRGGSGATATTGTGNNVLSAAPTLSGNVSLSTGNLVQGTAAKGVNFTANTPAAGMTSQLLNWYEEGTWTPTYSAATGGTIVSTGAATYTRTGRQVVVRGYVFTTNVSLAGKSGQVSISGLPFTASGDSLVSATALYVAGSYNAPLAFVSCGTVAGTLIGLQKPYLATAVQPFATTDLNTTGNANLVYFNATYFI